MRNELLCGDARELARTLPDESVSMIVTSPPYFGLRSYLPDGHSDKDKEIGSEQTPAEYVAGMVDLFRELRRALHPMGTLWINLGDSFLDKQLQGIPWRVAMGLQADGWWLRSDIIWAKRNPMPQSVQDRPTTAHEYLFLLSKSPQYFYDAIAVAEPGNYRVIAQGKLGAVGVTGRNDSPDNGVSHTVKDSSVTRNRRSVWTLSTEKYPAAHFATFPRSLVRPCILAGTSAYGNCAVCGSPYVRVVERTAMEIRRTNNHPPELRTRTSGTMIKPPTSETTGWQPSCECYGHFEEYEIDAGHGDGTTKKMRRYVPDGPQPEPVPAIVLDPFIGSGTTAAVCVETGRHWLGFELNPEYVKLSMDRVNGAQPALFSQGIA